MAVALAAEACSCAALTAASSKLTWPASSFSRDFGSIGDTAGRGAAAALAPDADAADAAAATPARAGAARAVRAARLGGAGRVARAGAELATGCGSAIAAPGGAALLELPAAAGEASSVTTGGSASSTSVRLTLVGQPALSVTVTTGSSITVVALTRNTLSLPSTPCVRRTRTLIGGNWLSP